MLGLSDEDLQISRNGRATRVVEIALEPIPIPSIHWWWRCLADRTDSRASGPAGTANYNLEIDLLDGDG